MTYFDDANNGYRVEFTPQIQIGEDGQCGQSELFNIHCLSSRVRNILVVYINVFNDNLDRQICR